MEMGARSQSWERTGSNGVHIQYRHYVGKFKSTFKSKSTTIPVVPFAHRPSCSTASRPVSRPTHSTRPSAVGWRTPWSVDREGSRTSTASA